MCDPQFDRKSTSFIFVCGYPQAENFKNVEYKTGGWKLVYDKRAEFSALTFYKINFYAGLNVIGRLK